MRLRRALVLSAIVFFPLRPPCVAAQGDEEPLTDHQRLSITSAISGSPDWSPDGKSTVITSSVTGGLATLPAEGDFPTSVPIELGGPGHFLASSMPGWSPRGSWISYVSNKSGSLEIWLWSTQDHYKPFRYETYEGESYYVLGRANRRRMMHDMLDSFDRFVKDDLVPLGESTSSGQR